MVVRYDDSETDRNNAEAWIVSETEELNSNADRIPRDRWSPVVRDEGN